MLGVDFERIVADGTPFGIGLGQRLGGEAEAKRWLREWQVAQVPERRAFAAEACAALDAQIHVHAMGRRAEQLLGPALSPDWVAETGRMWHAVMGRRCIYADASLQRALSHFDSAVAVVGDAVHSHDGQRMAETAKNLEQAQLSYDVGAGVHRCALADADRLA